MPYVPGGDSASLNKVEVVRYTHLERITAQVARLTSLGNKRGAMHFWHGFGIFFRAQRAIIGIRDAHVFHDMAGEVYKTGGLIRTGHLNKASFWATRISDQLNSIAFKVTGKHLPPISPAALSLALLRREALVLQREILNHNVHGIAAALRRIDAWFKADNEILRANQPQAIGEIAGLLGALKAADSHHRWDRVMSFSRRLNFTLLAAQAHAQGQSGG